MDSQLGEYHNKWVMNNYTVHIKTAVCACRVAKDSSTRREASLSTVVKYIIKSWRLISSTIARTFKGNALNSTSSYTEIHPVSIICIQYVATVVYLTAVRGKMSKASTFLKHQEHIFKKSWIEKLVLCICMITGIWKIWNIISRSMFSLLYTLLQLLFHRGCRVSTVAQNGQSKLEMRWWGMG